MGLKIDLSTKNQLHYKTKNDIDYVYKGLTTDAFTYPKTSDCIYDANCIKNSLHNILTFRNGEAILDPEFGISKIYELLYMPVDKYTANKMVKIVRSIIERYEPRIAIESMPVEYYEDEGEIDITIYYSIPSLNLKNQQYQFQLQQ